ncbi:MAG: dTDP-glucose 4,6-dehydratase [Dehalococcoidia bacterium]|jgi:dTDP-glucose 4,6-dehydratase
MKILVTGGAGFIGSNFIRLLLQEKPQWVVVNFDKLTYCGNLENLKDIQGEKRYRFVHGDIANKQAVDTLLAEDHFDAIINFAAESHVDRSILDPSPFMRTNIEGTMVLLEGANKYQIKKFVQVSTDEVYGSISRGSFSELSNLSSGSPYSASKAAADLLCLAYWNTYKTPVSITRCTNNYGPYQFPEKLIPLAISNVLEGKAIPVYGDGLNVRDWIYVEDHCRGLLAVLEKGKPGEVYNIAGSSEKTNLDIVQTLLKQLGKKQDMIEFVKDRPGHDRRYSLDDRKIRKELSWKPLYNFDEAIKLTVNWYSENESWWQRIRTGEYLKYYEKMYLSR